MGTRLGPYEILAPLGAGGMGEVYRARDPRFQREVAVKVLPDELVADPERRQRFEREARAAGTLQHPNVLAVYDVGVEDGRPYLVSELLSGATLRTEMRGGSLPVRKAVDYAIQVARGLAAAHERGVVHRDVKPENLFVTHEGRVCILDFGVAKLEGEAEPAAGEPTGATPSWHTVPGTRLGTSSYMSPEQVCGEPVDARSDIFSLGSVLYEMLAGQAPFQHATPFETLAAIVANDPPPLRRRQPDLAPPLERVVLRCLEKRRGERFQSAHDLAYALEAVAGLDTGALATDAVPPPKASRPWRLWLGGAVLVAVGLALGSLWPRERVTGELPWLPRQLTSDPGWEAEPALSPDGESVAYVSDRGGPPDLWLIQASGGEPLRLTSDEARERSPAWFPDGSALAFVSDRDGVDAVYKVPALGGKPVLLLRDAVDPAVSPDGTRVAFVQRLPSGQARLALVDLADPSQVRRLTGDDDGLLDHRQPAWSPDGRWLCFADFRDLRIVSSTGGTSRRLTSGQGIDRRPAWSPDGRSVYFASYREGTQALWQVPVDGGPARRLTFGTGPEGEPSLSRDGRRLAHSTFLSNPDIVILDERSGRAARVGSGLEEGSPAISPDGRRLVFASDRGGTIDLWQQALESGRPRGEPSRLTDLPGNEAIPAFSPDGRWLAYSRALDGRREIWIQPAAGGPPFRATAQGQDMHPSWSPDGSSLAFASRRNGQSRIWALPVADGRAAGPPVPVTQDVATDLFPVFLGDGSTIAFIRWGRGTPEVWMAAADGRQPARRLTRGADARLARWERASGSLLVSGTWGGATVQLRRVSPRSGEARDLERPVVFGPPTAVGDFDVAADGSFLAFVVEESRGDVWLLDARRRP